MGRSSETFNKKEKEKKRLKKQKDKEQKKEERKANSSKGKGLEDMLAYVDEFGNLSSTPPDPAREKTVNPEDIRISTQKQEDTGVILREGIVTSFNEAKGYGFIKDRETRESIFVHISVLTGPVAEGSMVTFRTEIGPKGLSAIDVTVVR